MTTQPPARRGGGTVRGVSAPFTVVVPLYDGAPTLAQALDSVLAQTFAGWRMVVVDDGSRDAGPAIADAYAARDPRIEVVRQPNGGVAAARNAGLRAARSRWVALLDQDDVWAPEKLERQLAFLQEHEGVACLGSWGWRIGLKGRRLGTFDVGPTSPEHLERIRAREEPVYLLASSAVLDRDRALAIGGFRRQPGGTDDLDLWTRLADDDAVLTVPERLVGYRVHEGSVSSAELELQRLATECIARNLRRRRAGEPELDWDAFEAEWRAQPVAVRRAAARSARTLAYYRRAGALLADRDLRGAWYLLRAALLEPRRVVRRAAEQVFGRANRGG